MPTELERRARELLAAEYDRDGRCNIARDLRLGFSNSAIDAALRAIAAALQAQQPGAQAVAWKIPRIVTFANAQRTNCPPDMQAELEGCVAWELSMFGDAAPVIDKHGTLHRPIPLYTAPPPLPEDVSEEDVEAAINAWVSTEGGEAAMRAALESYRARLAAKGGV